MMEANKTGQKQKAKKQKREHKKGNNESRFDGESVPETLKVPDAAAIGGCGAAGAAVGASSAGAGRAAAVGGDVQDIDDEVHPGALLSTEDVSLVSHTHGRSRRAERGISRPELQAAVKHGRREPAYPGANGRKRWRYTHNGVVYVTDASSRHEITSWRDDGQDLPVDDEAESHGEPQNYGAHVVLVVDASGSMRAGDVEGFASRTAAVYECLARDLVQPQGTIGFQSHYGNAVVSLIEMSDQARVLKHQVRVL